MSEKISLDSSEIGIYNKNKRIENETFPSFFELIIIYFVSH